MTRFGNVRTSFKNGNKNEDSGRSIIQHGKYN